ncbi:MAG: GNAT family N-acetyltransferase [Bacteroidia bacterium]|nr:MAG: GNAT family N-acetyltransferase [Bacteroidia bacterium]
MDIEIRHSCKIFERLSTLELYSILQLRAEVFVVEQNCPYQDLDDKDLLAYHLMFWHNNELIAYTRLIPAGVSFQEMSIGRVVVLSEYRNRTLGRQLMHESIKQCYHHFGKANIRISAQLYLKAFYTTLGFEPTSETYLEDNIEHVEMLLISE